MNLIPRTIFARLLLAFLLVAALPVLALGIVEFDRRLESDQQLAEERLTQQGIQVHRDFERGVAEPLREELRFLADSPLVDRLMLASETIQLLVVADVEKLFQRAATSRPSIAAITLVSRGGIERVKIRDTRRQRDYGVVGGEELRLFEQLRHAPAQTIIAFPPVRTPDGSTRMRAGISRLNPNTGKFGAAILIEYDLQGFLDAQSALTFHGVPTVWVMDVTGENVFLEPPPDVPRLDPRGPGSLVDTEGASAVTALGIRNDTPLLSAVISVPASVYLTTVRRTTIRYLIIFILSAVMAFGVALLLSRVISRPVVTLSDATARVAGGDLDVKVEMYGAEELESLGASFNTMIADLSQRTRDLTQASQIKTQFLANMSHELRTPLNAIIGFTRIVMRKSQAQLDERQYRNLGLVLQSAEHLLEMVNDLLDIERIEAGLIRISKGVVDLNGLASALTSSFGPIAEDNGLTFGASVGEDTPDRIRADPVRLRQILDNLIGNAIKYSESGHIELTITSNSTAGLVSFSVRDKGIGISEADLAKVFDPFHQVDTSKTDASAGVGLGLHLVRRLSRLLGGNVTGSSTLGEGSVFTLTLPLEEARPIASLSRPVGTGPVVLVIDDDPKALELIEGELVHAGYQVTSAQSGEAGLRKARSLKPAAIVLDIIMPDVDGWAVLKQLQSDPELSKIPVVVASLLDNDPVGYELGIAGWLTKPVTAAQFRAVFERVGVKPSDDVLVVEDHHGTMELIVEQLSTLDVSIRQARDGEAALEEAERALPKVLILDLLLPKLDGFRVLERFRKLPGGAAVPVVIYTGKDLSREDIARLNGGVVEVLYKDRGEQGILVNAVERALEAAMNSASGVR